MLHVEWSSLDAKVAYDHETVWRRQGRGGRDEHEGKRCCGNSGRNERLGGRAPDVAVAGACQGQYQSRSESML